MIIKKKKVTGSSNTTIWPGAGFTPLLTVLFIGLKLTHQIEWSWWWVLSPIWITFALVLAFLLVLLGLMFIVEFTDR